MEAPKLLTTERLHIHVHTEAEYAEVFDTHSDDEIMQLFGMLTLEEVLKQREKLAGGLTTYRTSVVFFHLQHKETEEVIGGFAFHNWYAMHNRSEIGYEIKKDANKNKGYMKEALPAIIAYGFDHMALNRMEAFIHPDNTASRKLAEGAGFILEAHLKEHYCAGGVIGDSLIYRLLRSEYKPLKN